MAATADRLSPEVGRAFYGSFRQLRPAQQGAVDPILHGDDVLVLAHTSSGKTEAVVAPLVQRHLADARQARGCSILYITPTRALANDLLRRLEPPLDRLGLVVGIRHGERNDLARSQKLDLLITTPESLDVLLMSHEAALADVSAVVLDEVHLTYNTQRGFQMAVLLKRLEAAVGRALQVIGLSATVGAPSDIWAFFRPNRPLITVRDTGSKPFDYQIREVQSPLQLAALLDTIADVRRTKVLLFANSRRECDSLGADLRGQTVFADRIFVHHSSLDRDVRLATEQAFLKAPSAVCIATSTLELGIDIGDIDLVMLYGHPGGWESFLQRVGRGNRRSEKTNVACLVSAAHGGSFCRILAFEALVTQIQEGRLERERPLAVYGAAAQQLVSMLATVGGAFTRTRDFAELLSAWPHLTQATVEQLLEGLATEGYAVRHGFQHRYGAAEQLHRLRDLRLIWGNFPLRSRDVKVTVAGRQLGAIPASNLPRLAPGMVIRFAGNLWRVRTIHAEAVEVEPSRQGPGIEITYGGSGIPLDPTVLEEMLRALELGVRANHIASETRSWFVPLAERLRQHVAWNRIPLAHAPGDYNYHYFTFAGRLVNGVIAHWAGLSQYEAEDVVLRSHMPIDFSRLPTDPTELQGLAARLLQIPDDLTIFQNVLPSQLLERELVDAWIKTPVFKRSLTRLQGARLHTAPIADLAPLCS
jgi:ATP-dependent helicase Lhr and Lhr-like helicase